MRIFGFVVFSLLVTQGAVAQTTYKSWNNPDQTARSAVSDQKLQEFVSKLKALVDKAETARAADPTFLRDLRDLAWGFDRPWQNLVFNDEFIDGNYEVDPIWRVLAGEYWIEKGWGLRSAIKAQVATADAKPSSQQKKDAAVALLGQIFNQALGGKKTTSPQAPAAPTHAAIHTTAKIPNAFAIEAQISSWTPAGRLEIVIYQGTLASIPQTAGYRMAYMPGGKIELLRVSSRGATVMDAATLATPLEDKKFHAIEWLRHRDGRMTVSVDGKDVLSIADRGFRDSFSGLAMVNYGGDYIVKKVQVTGAR